MTIVTVGEAVQVCLGGLTEPVELRGADGSLLGYFTPVKEGTAEDYAAARAHFDPEVIRKRKSDPGPWLSTEEVIRRMESQGDAK
jgi:hypothetical protein